MSNPPMSNQERQHVPRALIVAVQLDRVSDVEFESSLAELADLAKTLGLEVVGQFTQKRSAFDSTAYMGVGKREEIRQFLEHDKAEADRLLLADPQAASNQIEYILVDH